MNMPIEIERKFLVDHAKWKTIQKGEGTLYEQGYMMIEQGKTIRVRLAGEQGFLTIKGKTTGLSRPEFEYEIPQTEAKELLNHFCLSKILKRRYEIEHAGHLWEVDEFLGENEGLIVAEIELKDENETFELPTWIAQEVSHDKKYTNASLSIHPYQNWK